MQYLSKIYEISPWLACGLFFVLLCFLILFYKAIYRIVYPNDGKTKVFGDELQHWPFEAVDLMTDSEVKFFRLLQTAINNRFLIFSQVQLSRIINANEDADAHKWLNRINRMSVDYLLVDLDAQTPLVVIELDDWSHQSKDRIKADNKKDKALNSAGIPVMRFHGEQLPSVLELQNEIQRVVSEHYVFD